MQNEFDYIKFRDTPDGRLATMKNSRLPVYWVMKVARSYDMDIDKVVAHRRSCKRIYVEDKTITFRFQSGYPAA